MTPPFDLTGPFEGEDGWIEGGDARRPLQPADPSDLERYPPATAACRATRNRLRDYVDGDLPPALVRAIDEHVHGCRDCSLALARSEHEALLLRDALEPDGGALRSERPRLVRSIVARAAAELAIDEDRRVRRRARRTLRPAGVAAFAVVGLAVIFGVFEAVRGLSGPERTDSEVTVFLAEAATLRTQAGSPTSIGVGPLPDLGPGAGTLSTGPRGALGWRLRRDERVTRFELGGRGEVRIEPEQPTQLVRGELEVESNEALTIDLGPDAAPGEPFGRVRVPASTEDLLLSLSSEAIVPVDSKTGQIGLPRLRVEVLRASVAVRFDAGERSVELGVGEVALVSPAGDLRVEAGLSDDDIYDSIAASRIREPNAPSQEDGPRLTIFDANGEPLPEAVVRVRSMGRTTNARTDVAGTILLPKLNRLLVDVLPPEGSAASSFVPRLVTGEDATWNMPPERRWQGRLADADGESLERARIVPMLVDELFGRLHAFEELAVESGANGLFDLRRLPVKLLPYQRLVVRVSPPNQPAFVVEMPRSQREGIIQPRRRSLTLGGLSTGGFVELIEELPGLSLRAAVIWHRRRPDAFERVSMRTWGEGRLWLVRNGQLLGFVPSADDPEVLVPRSEAEGSDEVLRQLSGVARPYNSGSSLAIAAGRRHAQLHRTDAADRRQVVLFDPTGRPLEATTVYLELADGRIEVVGRSNGFPSFVNEPEQRPYRLVGVGANGSIGVKKIDDDAYADFSRLEVLQPGRVAWPDDRKAPDRVQLVGIGGAVDRLSFVVTRKLDSRRFAAVPAGSYEVRVRSERIGVVEVASGLDARPKFD